MNTTQTFLVVPLATLALSLSHLAGAQQVGHANYKVGRKSIVSITNSYGPVTVKASQAKEVSVTYTSYVNSVTFENERHGNHISLVSACDHSGDNLAEYNVLLPGHAFLSLFAGGPIHVEGLHGDITIQTANHPIEIKNFDSAYIHVKTLDGPVTLTSVRNSHVYIESINGSINISEAPGSWVEASSTRGRIAYDGDPGTNGDYRLSSQSGDVDVSIPANALVDIQTTGEFGQSSNGTATQTARNLFLRSASVSRARFELRSFMGKVRLKRPLTAGK